MMARLTEPGLRWALAYLLLLSGIDGISHQGFVSSSMSSASLPFSLHPALTTGLMYLTAIMMVLGSVVIVIGWRLHHIAPLLAVAVALSALMYQSLFGLILAGALVVLAMRASCLLAVGVQDHPCPHQCG
jgi:uncharacterized membrane protein YphA (DoxX/SURF4 family)